MHGSAASILIIGTWIGLFPVVVYSWFSTIAYYFTMRANRTERARMPVLHLPLWFLYRGTLTADGLCYRTRMFLWFRIFLISTMFEATLVGVALLLSSYFGIEIAIRFG